MAVGPWKQQKSNSYTRMLDGDMFVPCEELRVGYRIVAKCYRLSDDNSYDRYDDVLGRIGWEGVAPGKGNNGCLIESLDPLMIADCAEGHSPNIFYLSDYKGFWVRASNYAEVSGSGGSKGTGARIDQFPSNCPRCGMRAYVGLFEVEHADKRRSASCPARSA